MNRSILKQFFQDHWESFQPKLSRLVPEEMVEVIDQVVEKMLSCRDPEQGYYEYRCLKCGYSKTVALTCKSRFCTSCGKVYVDRWVEGVVKEVIDVEHRHVVLTIPEQLREVIYQPRELLTVMMQVAAETVREVIQSQREGVEPAILTVIHTFGRDLKFNPHVHVLVSEGGLDQDGQWRRVNWLPYKLLRKKWQYLLLTASRERVGKRSREATLISQLFEDYPEGFYVNAGSWMEDVQGATRYIGSYLARPAIAEYRITTYDGQAVTFWYEDHESGQRQTKTLNVEAFIERLIAHIAPKQCKLVRRFELYARRAKKRLQQAMAACRRAMQRALDFFRQTKEPLSWRQRLIKSYGKDPLLCPNCGTEMDLYSLWHRRYGYIYDLVRDAPEVKEEVPEPVDSVAPSGYTQLSLFAG